LQQKQELPIIIIITTFTCHAQQAHSALQDQKWATFASCRNGGDGNARKGESLESS
jgi:hypothetical protein